MDRIFRPAGRFLSSPWLKRGGSRKGLVEVMVFQAPMQLFCNKEFFGTLVTYGYDTPWATARLFAQDEGQRDRCVRVSSFLRWIEQDPLDHLSDEEGDKQYDHELVRQGLSEENIHWYNRAKWTIVTSDGQEHDVSSGLFYFDDDGFIQWRW